MGIFRERLNVAIPSHKKYAEASISVLLNLLAKQKILVRDAESIDPSAIATDPLDQAHGPGACLPIPILRMKISRRSSGQDLFGLVYEEIIASELDASVVSVALVVRWLFSRGSFYLDALAVNSQIVGDDCFQLEKVFF